MNELLGEDGADKEAARQALGIDLMELNAKIRTKADQTGIDTAVQDKVDRTELENRIQTLEEKIVKKGIPVGTIIMFSASMAPAGYLKADGSAVKRTIYPELFTAIGSTFDAGDGETTFNLSDLMGRFAQGNNTAGKKVEAGLPNIVASFGMDGNTSNETGY